MNIYSVIPILEILCINIYTTYKCSEKRTSKFVTLISVFIITVAITALSLLIVPKICGRDNGNGLFLLCGLLYIVPLKYLFNQPIKHLIIIMSTSWIYTMFAYSFSFRLAFALTSASLPLLVAIIQSLFFAATLPYYTKIVNKIFVYILKNIDNKMINSLLMISLSWFLLIFLLNYTYAEGNSFLSELVMLFVIICPVLLSYRLVYKLVSVNNKAKILKQISKIDTLTQLKNREGFYEDVLQKTEKNECFTIIFVDLDNFKSVNDRFGHAIGDRYLIEFVNAVKEILKSSDGFYRLHGDEFVLLVGRPDIESFCHQIESLKFLHNPDGISFKGISLGYSSFPADGSDLSELLYLADLRMYQKKKGKHRL